MRRVSVRAGESREPGVIAMKESFPIIPASGGAMWILGIIAILVVGVLVLFGYIVYSSRHSKIEISSEGLRIQGDLYGRFIPAKDLILDRARAVDLETDGELQLRWKRNGTGLPGYKAGWFTLTNREKALVFLTDRKRVVYIPTSEGFSLLLSVEQPGRFLETLRQKVR